MSREVWDKWKFQKHKFVVRTRESWGECKFFCHSFMGKNCTFNFNYYCYYHNNNLLIMSNY